MKKIFLVLAGLAVLFAPALVWGFSLSPLKFLVTVDPGQNTTVEVTIKNTDARAKNFKFAVLGARQDEKGRPVFGEKISPAENWVRPEKYFTTIKSGQSEKIKFLISVPKTALAGSYYVGLTAMEVGDGQSLAGQLATLLTIQVAGNAREQLQIVDYSVGPSIVTDGKINLNFTLQNTGNIELPLRAQATVYDLLGNAQATEKILDAQYLLAGAKRDFSKNILTNANIPGPHKVVLTVDYGLTKQKATESARVWLVPIGPTGAIVFLLIVLAAVTFKRKKHGV